MDDKNSNVVTQSLPIKCPSYSRVGHRAIKVGEQVLVVGGTDPFDEFLKPVLRFNLENFKVEVLSNCVSPNLQGFSLFTYKDTVYLWGGHLQNKSSNTLWSFQGTSFDICAQNGQIPSPRAFHNSAFIAGRYLLIYGGFNETEIFNDWFIFDIQTFTWNKVLSNRELPRNVKFEFIWEHGRGFLVSQCQISKATSKACAEIKNQFYQVRMVSFSKYKVRIDPFQAFQGQIPEPRSNFSLLFVEKQLWMLGGQIFDQNQSIFCNDIWVLNVETLTWNKKSILMNVKTGFQVVTHKNRIYLIGGIRSTVEMSGIVQVINVKNNTLIQTQICNFCKSVFNIGQKNYFSKPNYSFQIQVKDPTQMLTQISTNFLSKLAHFLQNPIQAIGLLIDNSLNMGSSLISIKLNVPVLPSNYFKQNQPYLFIGDNSKSFSSQQITRILFSFRFKVEKYYRDHIDKQDVKMRNQYGLNLKLASLRLGNSCLFVTSTIQDSIFVAYFSDCQTDCPDGDPSFNCFHYTIAKDGVCSNVLNRQIIRQNLRHLIEQKSYLNCTIHSTKVYVFNLLDLTKFSQQQNKFDISFIHSQGNLFNLSQYVSSLYLVPFLGREIYIQENRVLFTNLLTKFKEDQRNCLIQQIDTSLQQNIFSKIYLYKIIQNQYHNNFVYIYHQNRLITTVYSREKTICGFIEIPDLIEVDFFKSKLEKFQDQKKMMTYIQSKQEPRKRQRKLQNYMLEDQPRKIKPNYSQF